MLIRDLKTSEKFISGDKAILCELLHPGKSPLAIRFSLAHAVVKPGKATLPHRLKTSEVYYVLSGSGMLHINMETAKVRSGHAAYIPPGSVQFIENTGRFDLVFLCIVDPAWRSEDEDML
jgi:mannose-6-phosphate isomerase-like protein (cupin superfamily)